MDAKIHLLLHCLSPLPHFQPFHFLRFCSTRLEIQLCCPYSQVLSHISSLSNYRPISLLSLVSKLLEKHIHSLLYEFCISNNLISPFQFGFLPYRSTISALLFSTDTIFSLLESYSSVCGAFLDLRKAFDSVPHLPLLNLLASSNLPPPLLNWLHSYLLNRTQRVVVNGSSSSSLLVSSGVPQGSILGPFLFLIYVNGLTNLHFSPLTHIILYADDILIFKPISSPADMSSFQSDLDLISSWLSSHFLQINSSKSKYIFFSHKSFSYFDSFPNLTISRSPIERVSSFATLASSSLLLFHDLLTSLLSASNPVKSLAYYSDTFLLTLLLQLSLNSTFLLSAQSLNTGVSSGTLLLLPSLKPLTLSNTLLLKLLPNSALRSFLLYYPPSIFHPLPPVAKRIN